MPKDPYLKSFEDMGIDFMFVDESQQFKNLSYNTIQRGISGLGSPKGSAKAFNLLFAIRTLQKRYGGDKGTVFASGTPVVYLNNILQ
jgi:N12 class adenine-specific DNA methylase